jgi:hypothetical protein
MEGERDMAKEYIVIARHKRTDAERIALRTFDRDEANREFTRIVWTEERPRLVIREVRDVKAS